MNYDYELLFLIFAVVSFSTAGLACLVTGFLHITGLLVPRGSGLRDKNGTPYPEKLLFFSLAVLGSLSFFLSAIFAAIKSLS